MKYSTVKFRFNKGKPQNKVLLLMAGPLREGGGVKGRAIKEKELFFGTLFPTAIKLEGGGKALMARPLKEELLFAASQSKWEGLNLIVNQPHINLI